MSGVLHLGLPPARHITSWPDMDPAHTASPQNRFEQIEEALQQKQKHMTTAFADTHQSVSSLEHTMPTLAAQVQELAVVLTQPTATAPLVAPQPPVSVPSPSRDFPDPGWGRQSAMPEILRAVGRSSQTV